MFSFISYSLSVVVRGQIRPLHQHTEIALAASVIHREAE